MPEASATAPAVKPASAPEPSPLPTLMGEGYGVYRTRPLSFVYSFAFNISVGLVLIYSGHFVVTHREQLKQNAIALVSDISPYVLPTSNKESGGGGGGGSEAGGGGALACTHRASRKAAASRTRVT